MMVSCRYVVWEDIERYFGRLNNLINSKCSLQVSIMSCEKFSDKRGPPSIKKGYFQGLEKNEPTNGLLKFHLLGVARSKMTSN